MIASNWHRLPNSPRRCDAKTPAINLNYAGGHRLSTSMKKSQATSRLSTSEAGRVDVARAFPPFGHGDRRRRVDIDHSKIVVLCTRGDSRPSVLRCGEALSALLLECANAGLATCTLTHMIEMTPSRDIVRRLVGQTGLPQLLIRVGRAPAGEQQPPATPAAGAGRARVPILDASLSIPYSQGDRMRPGYQRVEKDSAPTAGVRVLTPYG